MLLFAAAAMLAAPDRAANFRADLATCRISPRRVRDESPNDIDNARALIIGHRPVSDRQLRCIVTIMARRDYRVWFVDPRLNNRYYDMRETMRRASDKADALVWLRQNGLPLPVPYFDPQRESLAVFAIRLEHYCGLEPHSLLSARATTPQSLLVTVDLAAKNGDQRQCVLEAMMAGAMENRDIVVRFVGK